MWVYSDLISKTSLANFTTSDSGRSSNYIGIMACKNKFVFCINDNFSTIRLMAIAYRRIGTNS